MSKSNDNKLLDKKSPKKFSTMFDLCVGKKTALLQAEVLACVSGLANVLF